MGFPHYVVDLREEFGDAVVRRFTSEYLAGRTPNPCVLCNTYVKWDALLRRADALGCDFIATGHYARVTFDAGAGRWAVRRGVDRDKDQSYALWGVAQEHLRIVANAAEVATKRVECGGIVTLFVCGETFHAQALC